MYFLAIDIGATSGKAILGEYENGKLFTKVINRFENNLLCINGKLCWDYTDLFKNIIVSLKLCKDNNTIPESIAIDTWGVDFVLLDSEDRIIGDTVSYRDKRTFKVKEEFHKNFSEVDLYMRTGIQIQEFNSIYQLKSLKDNGDELTKTKTFLMTPDYLNFLLTGKKVNEYTNITTTGLYDVKNNKFDEDLLNLLGISKEIFPELIRPGQFIGNIKKQIALEIGFDLSVYSVISHDTASAVFSNNIDEELHNIYISSGTWSLVGTVVEKPIINLSTYKNNLTNEGYVRNRITLIKNIMGLWMIECLRRESGMPSFGDISTRLKNIKNSQIINVNDIRFLSPKSMTEEIDKYLEENKMPLPKNIWERFYIVYNSLAYYYNLAIEEIERESGEVYKSIYIMGGGSKSVILNDLTKEHTGKEVRIGYSEATAIGNLLMQIKAKNNYEYSDLSYIEVLEDMSKNE